MSFKHFFKTHFTEAEVEVLNESRWWGKLPESNLSILEYVNENNKKRKLKSWKMEENGTGPAYVIEARGGCRYGLFRTLEGKFIMARMKGKVIKKPKGVFKEVDGKLVFELFKLPGAARIGGDKAALAKQVAAKKKAFDPEQTLLPKGGAPRIKVAAKTPEKPEQKFDPNATLRERRATAEPDKSMPNGEPTFDKNTDEWNKGVYTNAKS
jgi:hypothetical protein